jgi:hypothetical protein
MLFVRESSNKCHLYLPGNWLIYLFCDKSSLRWRIEGQEEIKQLVEPRFHPHTQFGRYEAIEPYMDATDRTYSAASEMRADGCALAY